MRVFKNLICLNFHLTSEDFGLSDFGLLRSFAHLGYHQSQSIPTLFFDLQLFLSGFSQFVKLRSATRLVFAPLAANPTFKLNAIESRIKCSLLYMEHVV